MPETVTLSVTQADNEAFAPFGCLLGAANKTGGNTTAFYGDAVEIWANQPLVMDDDACLSIARVAPRAPEVIWMERHFKHSQVFIPLNSQPFTIVVAPPNEDKVPDPDRVRAFAFDGQSAVMLHVGTWHEFPFATAQPVIMGVLLRQETNRDLTAIENGEALGDDLEKRAIAPRLGITFRF